MVRALATGVLLLCGLTNTANADSDAPIGDAIADIPLFDAHVHYQQSAWELYPAANVLSLMDRSGVAMALVSSTPDEGTISLLEYAPNRIVPELRPYHREFGPSNWTKSATMIDYLKQRIERYPHRGIGEFHIHQLDPSDKPLLQQVATLAMQHEAIVHIHSGADAVKLFYELEPRLRVIWAHAGMSEPPEVIEPLLARYGTLYVETSYRESDILAADGINPEWHGLIMKYPDRFLTGSDTWANERWDDYQGIIASNRRWLAYLPRDIAELIAFENAEKLFGIRISKGLFGTR